MIGLTSHIYLSFVLLNEGFIIILAELFISVVQEIYILIVLESVISK